MAFILFYFQLGHRMGKKPGGGPNKQVKCDICNITLNSELQAQQHYNGKNHLKKMKQVGMTMPGEEEGKRIIKQYGRFFYCITVQLFH